MLLGLGSVKGSPGVTTAALALAAVWPRPVVLVEADPAGADLAYRCRAEQGATIAAQPGLLTLAAAVRGGRPTARAVTDQAQRLACGVQLVQGVTSASQARGFTGGIWPAIAAACITPDVDVIADLGRLDRGSPAMALAQAADHLLMVASATLESVMHLSAGLQDVMGAVAQSGPVPVSPLLVGPEAHAAGDRADLDRLLDREGLPTLPTQSLPSDPAAVQRLERGESPAGRLGRTLLLRGARAVAGAACLPEGVRL